MPYTIENNNIILRHADKGSWPIKFEELAESLTKEDRQIAESVYKNDFTGLEISPLKIDGIKRSLALGQKIYNELPQKSIFLTLHSTSPRAELTTKLVLGKLNSLEGEKTIHLAEVDIKELTGILKDASMETWTPYEQMMKEKGISEEEALAKWMNDMQKTTNISSSIHPSEAANRYRKAIAEIRKRITSENTLIFFMGVGHSGALGQIKMENGFQEAGKDDSPQFCEVFKFNDNGEFIGSEKTEI
jgi:hypothetical protein